MTTSNDGNYEEDYHWPPETDLEIACYYGDVALALLKYPEKVYEYASKAAHHARLAMEDGNVSAGVN